VCAIRRMSHAPRRPPTAHTPGVHGLLLLGVLERLVQLDEDRVQLLQALAELPREPRRVDAHPAVLHDFIQGPLQVAGDPADVVAIVPPGRATPMRGRGARRLAGRHRGSGAGEWPDGGIPLRLVGHGSGTGRGAHAVGTATWQSTAPEARAARSPHARGRGLPRQRCRRSPLRMGALSVPCSAVLTQTILLRQLCSGPPRRLPGSLSVVVPPCCAAPCSSAPPAAPSSVARGVTARVP